MPSLLPRKTKCPLLYLPVLLSQFSTQSNQVERLSEALPRSGPRSDATVGRCSSFVLKLEVFPSLQTISSLSGDWSFWKDKGDAKLPHAHRLLYIKIKRRFLMKRFRIYWRYCPWSQPEEGHQNSDTRWSSLLWMLMSEQNVRWDSLSF